MTHRPIDPRTPEARNVVHAAMAALERPALRAVTASPGPADPRIAEYRETLAAARRALQQAPPESEAPQRSSELPPDVPGEPIA